jgi:trk system potassium uptake protein TrkA
MSIFSSHKKDREFAVIGLGRFGRAVVRTLSERGHSVLGIDRDPEAVQYISKDCTQAIIMDSTNEEALRSIGINAFDTVVVAIGTDFESNLITAVALKSLGVRRVICKALSRRQKDILLRVGADQVVLPESDAGQRLAMELSTPNLLDQIPLGNTHSIMELHVPPSLAGKSLAELDFRNRYGGSVVAIRHMDSVTVAPRADLVLAAEDIIVVIGHTEKIARLTDLD